MKFLSANSLRHLIDARWRARYYRFERGGLFASISGCPIGERGRLKIINVSSDFMKDSKRRKHQRDKLERADLALVSSDDQYFRISAFAKLEDRLITRYGLFRHLDYRCSHYREFTLPFRSDCHAIINNCKKDLHK